MVVFTCNHCGESLQKPRVEKHYQASTCSRNPIAVSCMDCFKDFKLEEYVAHTKCITEDERYSAKGTVHSVKKGEVKQSSWVQTVNSIIEQQQNAKPSIKRLLEMVSNYDNIPRKKVKFVNFVKSSSGGRIAPNDIEEVWSLLEAHKNAAKAETAENGNDKKKRKSDEDTPETNGEDSTAPKKKKKKNQSTAEISTETAAPVVEADKSSKKKNKKRKATETESEEKAETKEPETVTSNDQPKKKKKKGKTNSAEVSTQVNGKEEAKLEEIPVSSNEEKQKKKKNGGQSEEKVAEVSAVKGDATENGTAEEKSKKKKKNKNKTEAETTVTVVEETPVVNGNAESPKKKKKSKANGTVQNGEPVTQNGTTDNDADTDKKSKKKNKQKENGVNDTTLETNDGEFCWRTTITEVLKSQPKGIKKDKLKAKVFEKYTALKGHIDNEGKLTKQYSKKIKKIGNIKLENDVFTWVE
ncbi:uncharacterized protein CBL_02696 [Carabus blaptoides fortunei]